MSRFSRWFLSSTILILATTALLKLVAALQSLDAIRAADPLFPFLSTRQMLVCAAALEFSVVALLLRRKEGVDRSLVLLWLSALFLAYRVGLLIIGCRGPCWCLGDPFKWLGVSRMVLDRVAIGLLAYLVIGSVTLLGSHVTNLTSRQYGASG